MIFLKNGMEKIKKMKKYFIYLFVVLMMVFTLVSCQKSEPQQLIIGVLPDVDSIPFIIASEKGYFEDENVNVKIEYFKSPVDRDSALQSDNLDAAISDVLAQAFAHDNGFDIMITSMTNGSYKLLVNKDSNINNIKELKGKDIAISKNTIIEYTTDMMLEQENINPKDINKVIIPKIPTRLEMLQNGKIQAATLPEPLATVAMNNGSKLLNSSNNLNINPGVLIFTSKSINDKTKEIKNMYKAYNRAVDYLKTHDKVDYADILIEKAGFPDLIKDTLILPDYNEAKAPTKKDVEEVIKWLYEKELISKEFKYEEIVNTTFVR